MKAIDLKVGSIIEYYYAADKSWKESVITRCTDSFVWFKGQSLERIKRTTFENWKEFYRIKTI